MKKYLVTGGAGFIGANFVLYMLKKHDDIKIVDIDKLTYAGNLENLKSVTDDERHIFVKADICNSKEMLKLVEEHDPDCIVNFAAESHVDRSIEDPDIFAKTNVLGTLSLLNVVRGHWEGKSNKKFVQVSTDEVYGSLSIEEPDVYFTEDTSICPHSPYSASKASADMFVQAYGDTYGLPINITRCSNNYGPYQFPEKLIPLMLNNACSFKSLPVYGDGLNIRDWLFVEDHCKAIDLVIEGGKNGEVYNVGGHNERANIDIVKTIIKQLNSEVDSGITEELIEYVADRKGHDRRYGIDPTKIKKDLGWIPETKFEDGIKQTIQWYLKNKAWTERVTTGEYQKYYEKMYGDA